MAKTKQAAKRSAQKSVKKAASKKAPAKKSARPTKTAASTTPAKKTSAKPAKPKRTPRPRAAAETPIDIAARMGRKSGEGFTLDGHTQTPDETVLQEWAYDGFLNAGGFDAVKGSDDNDPVQLAAIKQTFFDSFKVAMRMRLHLAQPNALG